MAVARRPSLRPLLAFSTLTVLAVCAAGCFFVLRDSLLRSWWSGDQPRDLGVRVIQTGPGALELKWDRNAPAIRGAQAATLDIIDGRKRRSIDIDRQSLSSGIVAFRPESDDARLSLSVRTAAGNVLHEEVAIIGWARRESPPRTSLARERPAALIDAPSFSLPPRSLESLPAPPVVAVWQPRPVAGRVLAKRPRHRISTGARLEIPAF